MCSHQDSIPQLPASEEKTKAQRGWASWPKSLSVCSVLWPRDGAPQPPLGTPQPHPGGHSEPLVHSTQPVCPPHEATGREASLRPSGTPLAACVACGVACRRIPADKTCALPSPPHKETTVSEQNALPTLWDFLNYSNHFRHFLFSNF